MRQGQLLERRHLGLSGESFLVGLPLKPPVQPITNAQHQSEDQIEHQNAEDIFLPQDNAASV